MCPTVLIQIGPCARQNRQEYFKGNKKWKGKGGNRAEREMRLQEIEERKVNMSN
jgi:hypothetical protein